MADDDFDYLEYVSKMERQRADLGLLSNFIIGEEYMKKSKTLNTMEKLLAAVSEAVYIVELTSDGLQPVTGADTEVKVEMCDLGDSLRKVLAENVKLRVVLVGADNPKLGFHPQVIVEVAQAFQIHPYHIQQCICPTWGTPYLPSESDESPINISSAHGDISAFFIPALKQGESYRKIPTVVIFLRAKEPPNREHLPSSRSIPYPAVGELLDMAEPVGVNTQSKENVIKKIRRVVKGFWNKNPNDPPNPNGGGNANGGGHGNGRNNNGGNNNNGGGHGNGGNNNTNGPVNPNDGGNVNDGAHDNGGNNNNGGHANGGNNNNGGGNTQLTFVSGATRRSLKERYLSKLQELSADQAEQCVHHPLLVLEPLLAEVVMSFSFFIQNFVSSRSHLDAYSSSFDEYMLVATSTRDDILCLKRTLQSHSKAPWLNKPEAQELDPVAVAAAEIARVVKDALAVGNGAGHGGAAAAPAPAPAENDVASSYKLASKKLEAIYADLDHLAERSSVLHGALNDRINLFIARASIMKSKNINRLTRLAFFFVPAGFACSVFGMNVREWQDQSPKLITFIIVLVAVTAGTILIALIASFIPWQWDNYVIKKTIKGWYRSVRRRNFEKSMV